MTLPSWPSTLPRPTRAGYGSSLVDVRRPKPNDAKVPAFRRTTSLQPRVSDLTIVVSRSQKLTFDDFFAQATQNGTLPFVMPDMSLDTWPLLSDGGAPLHTEDGRPLLIAALKTCLFGEKMPREAQRGLNFTISFQVVEMP